jgi:hypothetical protein
LQKLSFAQSPSFLTWFFIKFKPIIKILFSEQSHNVYLSLEIFSGVFGAKIELILIKNISFPYNFWQVLIKTFQASVQSRWFTSFGFCATCFWAGPLLFLEICTSTTLFYASHLRSCC